MRYKFLLKGISELTIVQAFQRYIYHLKKQSNTDSLKYHITFYDK